MTKTIFTYICGCDMLCVCVCVHECGCGLVLFTSFTAILCVCWQLLRVKSYWILFMVFGCGLAVFTSITTFLEQILCPRGYSNVSIFSQPPHISTPLPIFITFGFGWLSLHLCNESEFFFAFQLNFQPNTKTYLFVTDLDIISFLSLFVDALSVC